MGRRWIYVVTLIGIMADIGFANQDFLVHEWEADSQTRGGKTVSCFVGLKLANEQETISMNLTLFAEVIAPQKVQGFTGLKIIVLRDNDRQIPVYSGWIKSSSGSTVGKMKKIDHPGKYFMGGTSGPELFRTILKGILRDGLSVGYQETPGAFDKVFKVAEPLPDDSRKALWSCLHNLQSTL
jgi:hypothetical protein